MKMKKNMTAFPVALILLAAPTLAADEIDIRTWKLDEAGRSGWSVKKLIGTKAFGPNRKQVGEVENLIFGPDGKVRKLIVTTGGFLGIGDTALSVNWKDVKVGPEIGYVNTPLTAEGVEKYGLFDGMSDQVPKGPREWRATELIGDYVNLKKDVRYGHIRDLIISKDGELKAVIVSPDRGYVGYGGYYAYPYYGYGTGWDPGYDRYDMPFGKTDIAALLPYAYNKK